MTLTLKQARLIKEVTQKEIALAIGVSEHIYRGYESNPDSVPIGIAKKISKELDIGYDVIFFNNNSSLTRDNPKEIA